MQALCGLQGIFDLFNCKTPEPEKHLTLYRTVYLLFLSARQTGILRLDNSIRIHYNLVFDS